MATQFNINRALEKKKPRRLLWVALISTVLIVVFLSMFMFKSPNHNKIGKEGFETNIPVESKVENKVGNNSTLNNYNAPVTQYYYSDSSNKKDIKSRKSLPKKNNDSLKNQPTTINVTSNNQRGGQTAYEINNK